MYILIIRSYHRYFNFHAGNKRRRALVAAAATNASTTHTHSLWTCMLVMNLSEVLRGITGGILAKETLADRDSLALGMSSTIFWCTPPPRCPWPVGPPRCPRPPVWGLKRGNCERTTARDTPCGTPHGHSKRSRLTIPRSRLTRSKPQFPQVLQFPRRQQAATCAQWRVLLILTVRGRVRTVAWRPAVLAGPGGSLPREHGFRGKI